MVLGNGKSIVLVQQTYREEKYSIRKYTFISLKIGKLKMI